MITTAHLACVLSLAFLACRESGSSSPPERDRKPVAQLQSAARSAALAGLAGVVPDWQRAVPSEPGRPLIERSHGPVPLGRAVLVASSAVGFAALTLATGEVAWQKRGEHYPGRPGEFAGYAALPGRCRHLNGRPGAVGCVQFVDAKTGALASRRWLRAPADAEPALVTPRDGPLGLWQGFLLWRRGLDVVSFDLVSFELGGAALPASSELIFSARYRLASAAPICGLSADAGEIRIAICRHEPGSHERASDQASSLAVFRRRASAPLWRVQAERTPGVAGPVRAGNAVIWGRDGHLEAFAAGSRLWRARGRYAYAQSALAVVAGQPPRVFAVRADGGIRPVILDATSGRVLASGQPCPGIQVLAAAFYSGGAALAVRLDRSLFSDAIFAYDRDLRIAWAWPVPAPQRVRVDPVGLAIAAGAVVVFRDGRYVARLPLPRRDAGL